MDSISKPNQLSPFPTTQWTLVLQSQSPEEAAHQALDALCRAYWLPVHGWIWRQVGQKEEAEDLTQAYFHDLLQRDYIRQADADKGKFRTFLLTDVSLFLSKARRDAGRLKRGGGASLVSADELAALEDPDPAISPDQWFDRRWAQTLLRRALARLQEDYLGRSQGDLYQSLKVYLSWNPDESGYAEAASAAGMTPGTFRVAVHRMRRRFRSYLENEVARTVDTEADLKEEIAYLLRVMGH